MKLVTRIRNTLAGSASPPPIPYFAEYSLNAENSQTIAPDMKSYPGLLLYYLIDSKPGEYRVATYWSTKEHFLRDAGSFQRDIGATAEELRGFVHGLTARPESIWTRIPWYTVVLGIAAFLGAVQAIGNYFDWIFGAPHLALKLDKARVHLIEDAEFREQSSLVNVAAVAHREISVSAYLKSKSNTVRLNVNPSEVPHIAGSAAQEISITGVAPAPGQYDLVVGANGSAGLIRSAKNFQFSRPVTVWPKAPVGALSLNKVQGDTALLAGSVAVGPAAPNGLDCELEITGIADLKYDDLFEFPMLYQSAQWRSNETSGSEVASLRWAVLPVPAQDNLRFQIALMRPSPTDWNKVSEQSTVRCTYRKEKIRNVP